VLIKTSFFHKIMILCASTLSNTSLIEEATKCLFRTSLRSTHSTRMCFTVNGHWQVPHSCLEWRPVSTVTCRWDSMRQQAVSQWVWEILLQLTHCHPSLHLYRMHAAARHSYVCAPTALHTVLLWPTYSSLISTVPDRHYNYWYHYQYCYRPIWHCQHWQIGLKPWIGRSWCYIKAHLSTYNSLRGHYLLLLSFKNMHIQNVYFTCWH